MKFPAELLKTFKSFIPDSAVAWGARNYFNQTFHYLGTMTTLQIDSANQKATLDLELKGESQPLHITINRYEVTTQGDKTFIELRDVKTSREWITALAGKILDGRKFEIPAALKAVL